MIKQLKTLFWCKLLKHHEWTNKAHKGLPPEKGQFDSLAGVYDYTKMYCDRCGCESKVWREHKNKFLTKN